MKHLLLSIVLLGVALALCAEPEWQWAKAAGGPYSDRGRGVACDEAGNMYVTGYFRVSADFDTIHVVGQGGTSADIFVAKYDAQGMIVWVAQAGSAGTDEGCALVLDAGGNIYVTGYIGGPAVFGGISLSCTGSANAFVGQLNPNGVWTWVCGGNGAAGTMIKSFDLVLGGDGYLYTCGEFEGLVSFGGHLLTPIAFRDIWAAKLDLDGTCLWAVSAGGTDQDQAKALAWEPVGGVVLTGYCRGDVDFGANSMNVGPNFAGYLAWLSEEGIWVGSIGLRSMSSADCTDVAVNADSEVYVTGITHGNLLAGSIVVDGDDMGDAFIAKFAPRGTSCIWAQSVGAASDDSGLALALTPSGAIYWVGYFLYTIELGDFSLTYVSSADLFLARLDAQGNYLMALQAGGVCEDMAQSMCTDSSGNIYLVGYYDGEMYFGDYYLPFHGDDQIFCAKLHETVANQDPGVTAPDPGLAAYPNPFCGSTTISYALKQSSGKTELAIYDTRGRKVRTLASTECAPGSHRIEWDGRNQRGERLPAGLYFCRLSISDACIVSKLALLR